MSNIAIKVEGIGKRYDLHRKGAGTLRDTLANAWKQGFGALSNRESFWALKDVSFEVPHGQVLGIIGRNGAGKSTLLKILSRITPPTKGRVEIDGRVASLLEVGTGFHPELTGRENIFLNGAILGMSRAEIRRKFDEIVDFSGVERFLDMPVKHYSSGMYVRLAFAVAAHLEAEILLIDEVLAVGDVEFQRKCLKKVNEITSSSRTVIIVSHNPNMIKKFNSRAILLHDGKIAYQGNCHDCFKHYHKQLNVATAGPEIQRFREKQEFDIVIFKKIKLTGNNKINKENLSFLITLFSKKNIDHISIGSTIFNEFGHPIGASISENFSVSSEQTLEMTLKINAPNLVSGKYSMGFSIGVGNFQNRIDFDIVLGYPAFDHHTNTSTAKYWNSAWGNFRLESSIFLKKPLP